MLDLPEKRNRPVLYAVAGWEVVDCADFASYPMKGGSAYGLLSGGPEGVASFSSSPWLVRVRNEHDAIRVIDLALFMPLPTEL